MALAAGSAALTLAGPASDSPPRASSAQGTGRLPRDRFRRVHSARIRTSACQRLGLAASAGPWGSPTTTGFSTLRRRRDDNRSPWRFPVRDRHGLRIRRRPRSATVAQPGGAVLRQRGRDDSGWARRAPPPAPDAGLPRRRQHGLQRHLRSCLRHGNRGNRTMTDFHNARVDVRYELQCRRGPCRVRDPRSRTASRLGIRISTAPSSPTRQDADAEDDVPGQGLGSWTHTTPKACLRTAG